MPVYVRRYMIGEIEDIKKKEKEAIEGDSSSSTAGETASREDIGQAMEQLQKQNGEEQADEEIIKEVFGTEEERRKAQNQGRRQPKRNQSQRQPQEPQRSEEKPPEQPSEPKDPEEDPAKAKDLEQFMDKLQDEM